MECIVHFEVHHPNEIKELRGLIFLKEGQVPSERDFLTMFEEMGYKLRLEDRDNLVFKPVEAGANYSKIRIRRLDTGVKSYKEDTELRSLLGNFLQGESRPI
ncbi:MULTISPECIES: hypothetical protein [Paenibacillus]|uniref:Uncharacterized protein n=1 Tax=Paenibacillus vini TaxID=1476024 RepID=A0ABQ4ME45_9BACL|nr:MULTISPECIES: hypothetical protein [Paenibacillus]MBQ4900863.1 hypothetical protein [Paenibacillus sp. Marseille-P2973]MDN4069756.1 hypothetical protein [Paenibacillus vini]GIP54232.1 hypothetical protein J42TS3_32670 [Paenibacillus vini]